MAIPTLNHGHAALRVAFDASAGTPLRMLMLREEGLFVEAPEDVADVVIFGRDDGTYLDRSETLRRHRRKSICISESDIPTFLIPSLYAANRKGFLSRSRAMTMNYFLSAATIGNEEVAKVAALSVPKTYLYSFMGGMNSWPRRRLLKLVEPRPDTLLEATDTYNHWVRQNDDSERQAKRRFAEVMAASKFVLCPRGCGNSSYRLFETMSLGIAPVVISDSWRPMPEIDWRFAIFVPERRIRHLDAIVRAHQDEWDERGRAALAEYRRVVAPDQVMRTTQAQIIELLAAYRSDREMIMSRAARLRVRQREAYWASYAVIKRLVLLSFARTGTPFPFALHRPIEQQLRRGRP